MWRHHTSTAGAPSHCGPGPPPHSESKSCAQGSSRTCRVQRARRHHPETLIDGWECPNRAGMCLAEGGQHAGCHQPAERVANALRALLWCQGNAHAEDWRPTVHVRRRVQVQGDARQLRQAQGRAQESCLKEAADLQHVAVHRRTRAQRHTSCETCLHWRELRRSGERLANSKRMLFVEPTSWSGACPWVKITSWIAASSVHASIALQKPSDMSPGASNTSDSARTNWRCCKVDLALFMSPFARLGAKLMSMTRTFNAGALQTSAPQN